MQFLCLIYETESLMASKSEEEIGKIIEDYTTFTEEVKANGKMVAGDALQPTTTATTVRVRHNETILTDGPFAETKEQLGGYYLLECESLEEAIELAAKIPGSQYGSVEVRPIMVFDH